MDRWGIQVQVHVVLRDPAGRRGEADIRRENMPMGRPRNKTGIPVDCPKCGNHWLTNGKGLYVPCPKCHTSVKIPGRTIEDLKAIVHAETTIGRRKKST